MASPSLQSALVGEFLGTALLVLLGDGVVASVVLLDKQADWIVITTGWAFAVMLGIYVSGRLSGGHLNPAVTLALAARGEFPRARVAPYWAAQVAGAFVPRLASALLGWGSAVFRSHGWYFWVPIVGPLAGGIAGACLYDLAIARQLPPADEPSPPGRIPP